ncbi:MAG: metalloregulator ArsR/SmtB family transcription factor [Myxococcota bacterium]
MGAAAERLDLTLSALADPTRRRVVELLREAPRRPAELATALGASRPAMSKHLRVLRNGGLVSESTLPEDARVRVYRLEPAPFEELGAWLDAIEALWAEQLDAFAAHVAKRGGS